MFMDSINFFLIDYKIFYFINNNESMEYADYLI